MFQTHVVYLHASHLTRLLEILDNGGSASDSIYIMDEPGELEEVIYLTRRNILTLQLKLARIKGGDFRRAGLQKNDTQHSRYPCTVRMAIIPVTDDSEYPVPPSCTTRIFPVEDEDYYIDREPGAINPLDDPGVGISASH
jgi:hypothetical protein